MSSLTGFILTRKVYGRKMIKAIALFSGGLDSILAVRVILEQGIEVEAVNFLTAFCDYTKLAKTASEKLGIKLKIFDVNKEFFEILKNPKYGYGSNLNPCIDCHMFMLKKAGWYLKETGAEFIITGEVLGERPMSQRRDALKIVEKGSGLEGLVLRPLSAKLLEPTIAEKKGLVDREKLLAIHGRSRKPQLQLAGQFGITEYPSPAGGCLLTDPAFSLRMKDLMEHDKNFSLNDVELLKTGRHFRLTDKAKLIVGRNREENKKLLELAEGSNSCFYPLKVKGPVAIGRGSLPADDVLRACAVTARYCDRGLSEEIEINSKKLNSGIIETIKIKPAVEDEINNLRI